MSLQGAFVLSYFLSCALNPEQLPGCTVRATARLSEVSRYISIQVAEHFRPDHDLLILTTSSYSDETIYTHHVITMSVHAINHVSRTVP